MPCTQAVLVKHVCIVLHDKFKGKRTIYQGVSRN